MESIVIQGRAYSRADYLKERRICDKAQAYAEAIMCEGGTKRRRNYLTADEAKAPAYAKCNNDMRSRVEAWEILSSPPVSFGAYLKARQGGGFDVTTWTGDPLGHAVAESSWATPRSHMAPRMFSGRATVAGGSLSLARRW